MHFEKIILPYIAMATGIFRWLDFMVLVSCFMAFVFHFVVFRYILWISLRFVLCHRKGILLQMARHTKQRQFLCRISIEEMWYGLLINCLLHGTYCLELFQFDWFLSNYNLKIFHKLKFMTIFFSSNFPSPRKITTEQVNRKFIIYQLIIRTWWIRWINRKCFMWRSKKTSRQ